MFDYVLEKLDNAAIDNAPFPHIYLDDLLTPDHFQALVGSEDVALPESRDVHEFLDRLELAGYAPIEFPGCTNKPDEYIAWLESGDSPRGLHAACEGLGMALRCTSPRSEVVQDLDAFFRSDELTTLLARKFGITRRVTVDAGLQKYLNGYEISPHPDIRQKALTWLFNANPGGDTESLSYHTHYMAFKEQWDFIRRFWRDTPHADTCWVPWEWCETRKRHTANNSIVVFAPRYDTLHGVKANYDHLRSQRTQFYGNLWYRPTTLPYRPEFHEFAAGTAPRLTRTPKQVLKSTISALRWQLRDWRPER